MFHLIRHYLAPMRLSDGLRVVTSLANENGTVIWYDAALRSLILKYGDIPVGDITRAMVYEWSKGLDTSETVEGFPYSQATINSYRRAIRAYFNHLVRLEHLAASPADGVKIPSVPRMEPKHFSEKEARRILKHAASDLRDNAMIQILYETGCRVGELHSMRVSCLHFERRRNRQLRKEEEELLDLAEMMGVDYMVKSQFATESRGKALINGKTGAHFVYFGHEACMALTAYMQSRPHHSPDELWLNRNEPTAITKQSIYHAFKQVCDRAGVTGTPHMMRHTFAFRMIRAGADMKMVQRLMGHSDMSTTMLYYDYTDDELWDLHDELNQKLKRD